MAYAVVSKTTGYNDHEGSTPSLPTNHPTKYKDNTVEISLHGGLPRTFDTTSIEVYLVETKSISENVKATYPVEPHVDITHLSAEVQKLDETAKEESSSYPDSYPYKLAPLIQGTKEYSINPEGKENVEKQNTSPEQLINSIAGLEKLDCNPAATLEVLLANQKGFTTKDNPIDVADGYIATNDSPAGSEGLLSSDDRHLFAVNGQGTPVDATPIQIADDKETQELIQQLHDTKSRNKAWEQLEEQNQKSIDERNNTFNTLLTINGITLTLGTLLLATKIPTIIEKQNQ